MTKARQNADNFAADITGVTAGTGITGGGTSGAVTVTLDGDAVIAPTIFTTEGDLIVGDASGDPVRLAVGAAGEVLTSDGDTVSFLAPAGAGKTFTLLNSPSTTLSGSTVTISSIGGHDQFFIMFFNASGTSATPTINIRFNGDTGNNYGFMGGKNIGSQNYTQSSIAAAINQEDDSSIKFGIGGANASAAINGSMLISGANSSGVKVFEANTGPGGSGNEQETRHFMGTWTNAAAIDSISFILNSGTYDSGNVKIYGAV